MFFPLCRLSLNNDQLSTKLTFRILYLKKQVSQAQLPVSKRLYRSNNAISNERTRYKCILQGTRFYVPFMFILQ